MASFIVVIRTRVFVQRTIMYIILLQDALFLASRPSNTARWVSYKLEWQAWPVLPNNVYTLGKAKMSLLT